MGYGNDYVERRWPWFPEDFDWTYFNAAPAALQIEGYLRGDEPVVLENLHPEHQRYGSRLPGLRVRCFVTRVGERGEERFDEVEMRLDTLWIDGDAERLVLVWRGWTGVADEDFEEVRHAFIITEPTTEAPRGLDHYRVRLADGLAEETAGPGGVAPARPPAEGAAAAAPVGAGPGTTGIESSQDPATPGADSRAAPRSAAAPREPPGGLPPDPDPRDRETAELFESVMARARAVTGIDLSTFDPTDPDAATARIKDYLRQQGIDPDRPPELTPEQRQAQAALFEGLGIPWDPVAGQPDLDRLETMDLDATLRRTLEKLDADLKARGLPAREEPPPLTPEAAEAMRSIGIDPEALFAYLKSQASTADTPTHTKPLDRDAVRARLLDGRSLGGADLSGQDLSGLDLAGLDLARATLAGANLTGARLAKTRLSGTDLSHANLAGADLSGADLAGARLCEADLTGADLTGADASGADLTGVVAEGCVLREARLYRAIATGAYLAHADLGDTRARGLGLDGADLHGACLDGADLRRASLREARLFGVSAVGALFDYADLTGARVSEGARLADASLRQVSGSDSLWMD
jgi:uncharacterized protein YjbI with pentapeptide repeats